MRERGGERERDGGFEALTTQHGDVKGFKRGSVWFEKGLTKVSKESLAPQQQVKLTYRLRHSAVGVGLKP